MTRARVDRRQRLRAARLRGADAEPDEDAVRRAEQRRADARDRRRARGVHRSARRRVTRSRRTRSTIAPTSGRSSNAACARASASTPSARSTRRSLPGELAVPDQLIDYTHGRAVDVRRRRRARAAHRVHASRSRRCCAGRVAAAAADCGFAVRAGTYGVTQGPRLETAAEIERLARDGCAMVGMTAMPEAALARELGIDYAICAVAVNYAAGRSPDGAVDRGADRAVHGRRAAQGASRARAARAATERMQCDVFHRRLRARVIEHNRMETGRDARRHQIPEPPHVRADRRREPGRRSRCRRERSRAADRLCESRVRALDGLYARRARRASRGPCSRARAAGDETFAAFKAAIGRGEACRAAIARGPQGRHVVHERHQRHAAAWRRAATCVISC